MKKKRKIVTTTIKFDPGTGSVPAVPEFKKMLDAQLLTVRKDLINQFIKIYKK